MHRQDFSVWNALPLILRGLEAPPSLAAEEQLNLMAENAVVIAAALLKRMSRCINFTGGISEGECE